MKRYRANPAARGFSNFDAQALQLVIEYLGESAPVTYDRIVEKARLSHSKIHHLFDWKNPVAATKWRHHQAEYYVRHIDVVIITDDQESEPERAYQRIMVSGGESQLIHIDIVSGDQSLLDQAIAEALRRLRGAQRAVCDLLKHKPSPEDLTGLQEVMAETVSNLHELAIVAAREK